MNMNANIGNVICVTLIASCIVYNVHINTST